jgi:hypothetical protein
MLAGTRVTEGCTITARAGLLQKMGMESPEQVRMEATLASGQDAFEKRFAAQLRDRAADSWQVNAAAHAPMWPHVPACAC